MARARIGEMLVSGGQLDPMQLDSALAHQRQWGGRLGQAIVQLGFLSEETVLAAVGYQVGAPHVVIGQRTIPPAVLGLVPARLVRSRRALPLQKLAEHRRGPLVVALADPADLTAIDEIAFVTGLDVRPMLAAEWDLDQAIARHLGVPAGAERPAGAQRPTAVDLPPDTSPVPKRKGFFH